jgi:cell division protease FtsH
VPGVPPPARDFSEETAREIDKAVRELVGQAFERARALLVAKRDILERGAQQLLAKETLVEEDLRALLAAKPLAAPAAAAAA